jgi:hypothetical protein
MHAVLDEKYVPRWTGDHKKTQALSAWAGVDFGKK